MARIKGLADRGILLEWRSGFFAINRMADRDNPGKGASSTPYLKRKCDGYLHDKPDGTEILTCAHAVCFADEGFDGILHIHAFGCLPQAAVLPALQKISRDRKIPLLSVSIGDRMDLSSLDTRIEAFIDILMASTKTREENA
jgi:predicted nucleotide-binding protein (sugar kinase/HSP70/actin superfamily)